MLSLLVKIKVEGYKMFENIGSKIKTVAKVVCWIGIIASIISGIVLIAQDEDTAFLGFLVIVLGSVGSWVGSFITYGFGQLVENSDILVKQGNRNYPNAPTYSNQANTTSVPTNTATQKHQWRCDNCGNMISDNICPICGKESNEITDKRAKLTKWKEEGLITDEEYKAKMENLK